MDCGLNGLGLKRDRIVKQLRIKENDTTLFFQFSKFLTLTMLLVKIPPKTKKAFQFFTSFKVHSFPSVVVNFGG